MNNNSKNIVMCFSAHPDDEVLGLGGTLIKHIEKGDKVFITILSEGEDAKISLKDKNLDRINNARDCSKSMGTKINKIFNFPDQKFDTVPLLNIIQSLEKELQHIKPNIVYTHHLSDINIDHRITTEAVLTALRPMNKFGLQPEIRTYETPSTTDQSPYIDRYLFKPNLYVSIEKTWNKKVDSIKKYKKEIKKTPHPRSIKSIKALAVKRGSESGFKLAEAFTIIKKIWD